eukprot:1494746-Pyramimonas_sp.AAC.1
MGAMGRPPQRPRLLEALFRASEKPRAGNVQRERKSEMKVPGGRRHSFTALFSWRWHFGAPRLGCTKKATGSGNVERDRAYR